MGTGSLNFFPDDEIAGRQSIVRFGNSDILGVSQAQLTFSDTFSLH